MRSGPGVAVVLAVATAAGILSTVSAASAVTPGLAATALTAVAPRRSWRLWLAAATVVSIGVALGAAARDRVTHPSLQQWFSSLPADDSRLAAPVVVTGTLLADATPAESGAAVVVGVREVAGTWGRRLVGGCVQVHVSGTLVSSRIASWTRGRPVRVPMVLRRPAVWLNPGGPSLKWQALQRDCTLLGSVKSAALIEARRGHWWDEAAAATRARVRATSARLLPGRPASSALVTAILIGDRAGLDEDLMVRMRAAGTYHVLAISGGNIALLTMLCLATMRPWVRSGRMVSLASMVVVVAYGWVVGSDPSVERAVTASCVYLSSGLIGLRPRAVSVIAIAVVAVLLRDPLAVIDVARGSRSAPPSASWSPHQR